MWFFGVSHFIANVQKFQRKVINSTNFMYNHLFESYKHKNKNKSKNILQKIKLGRWGYTLFVRMSSMLKNNIKQSFAHRNCP